MGGHLFHRPADGAGAAPSLPRVSRLSHGSGRSEPWLRHRRHLSSLHHVGRSPGSTHGPEAREGGVEDARADTIEVVVVADAGDM